MRLDTPQWRLRFAASPQPAGAPSIGVALDSATAAWVAAVITNGGTVSSTQQGYVDTLIAGLKADGIWTELDRLWLFASENTQQALTDIVANTLATNNSTTFTVNRGFKGNGTTQFVNSNYNPATQGVAWTRNATHGSVWDNTSPGDGDVLTGANGSTGDYNIDISVFNANRLFLRINDGDGSNVSNVGGSLGHWIYNRDTSTTKQVYLNGGLFGTKTFASAPIPSANIYVCARNANGTLSTPTADQICCVSYGGSLSATDAANFYARLRTYMTAVGVP